MRAQRSATESEFDLTREKSASSRLSCGAGWSGFILVPAGVGVTGRVLGVRLSGCQARQKCRWSGNFPIEIRHVTVQSNAKSGLG